MTISDQRKILCMIFSSLVTNDFKIYIIVAKRNSTFWKVVSKFPMATAKHILKIMRMNSTTIEALSLDFIAQYHWKFRATLPNLLYSFCTLINIFVLFFASYRQRLLFTKSNY